MKKEISRRAFVHQSGIVTSGMLLLRDSSLFKKDISGIKAILFDGFPIFDPRPVFETVRALFPGNGEKLNEIWRSNQFSYQWLRVTANKYKNFWDVSQDALEFAAAACGLSLTAAAKNEIMNQYRFINLWPDVLSALEQLKEKNFRLGILSNMTADMLNRGIQNSNTGKFFDYIISTDGKKTFKPSPVAYHMGVDTLQLKKEEILFVAFASWDMAGAKWFGYPTFWVNRLQAPPDRLDAVPDGTGKDLFDLVQFVNIHNHNE